MLQVKDRRLFGGATFLLFCVVVLAMASRAPGERPVSFSDGNTQMAFETLVSPSKLPSDRLGPAELTFSTRVSTQDGRLAAALQQLLLETDRHLNFDFKEVPVCHYARIQDVNIDWDRCRRAVVGNGMVEFEIAFPEAAPIAADGNALIYNGGLVHGKRRLWLRFPITVPTPAILVEPIDITRAGQGRSRLALSISKVAGGNGSLSYLLLRLRKGVLGSCPTGRLSFRVAGEFVDGTRPARQLSRRCRRG